MTMIRIYTLTGAIVIAAASSMLLLGGKKKTPEQRETMRRQRINAQGRITDGTVLDVQEFDSDTDRSAQLVIYTYDVNHFRSLAPEWGGRIQSPPGA